MAQVLESVWCPGTKICLKEGPQGLVATRPTAEQTRGSLAKSIWFFHVIPLLKTKHCLFPRRGPHAYSQPVRMSHTTLQLGWDNHMWSVSKVINPFVHLRKTNTNTTKKEKKTHILISFETWKKHKGQIRNCVQFKWKMWYLLECSFEMTGEYDKRNRIIGKCKIHKNTY